jgi:RHS repeat-associated protein
LLFDNNLKQVKYLNAVIATPSVSFTYDTNFNRLLSMTDGIGTTTYGYNTITVPPALGAGRLASVTGPLPNSTLSYNYDQLGRTTNRAINGVAQAVTIDTLGRPTIITNALGTFSNVYVGGTSRIATDFYPNGQRTEFSYSPTNNDLRLQTIWNRKSNGDTISRFDYTYDPDGEITSWTQQTDNNTPNVWVPEYDSADQLLGVIVHSNTITGAILKQFAYDYDRAANRTSELIQTNSSLPPSLTSSTINSLIQQLSVSGAGPMRFKGHLDEIASVTVGGSPATVDPKTTNFVGYANVVVGTNVIPIVATDYSGNVRSNRYQVVITNGVTRTLAYDLSGNMISNMTAALATSYEWDAANRLTAISSGTNRSEISYDGFGRRYQIVEKQNGSIASTKTFLWCGPEVCEERDATGGTVTKRFFGQGEQISATNYFFTRDHLGSVREMADAAAALHARYDYTSYGARTKLSGDLDADFGFTGHYLHAMSGLCLTFFRAYSPDIPVWLSRDPLGTQGAGTLTVAPVEPQPALAGAGAASPDPLSLLLQANLNPYAYCDNSPLGGADPLGLCNYVKTGVGIANIVRGVLQEVKGTAEALIGVPALILGPATGPLAPLEEAGALLVSAKAGWDVVGGGFKMRRGIQQISEALPDKDFGHLQNLLGLAPFGALYDDPGENLKTAWQNFKDMSLMQKIGEVCTFGP